MQELDNEFFEAYKRLDRLCSDMYGCRNGVSQYIEDMDRLSYQGQFAVSSWEQTYRMLKHLRWVRNQIAHDSGQIQICDECDIPDVNSFYDDLISGCDPLTQLRRNRQDCAAVKNTLRRAEPISMPTVSEHSGASQPTRRRTVCFVVIVTIFLLAIITAIILYLLTSLP